MIRKRRQVPPPLSDLHPETSRHLKLYYRELEWVVYWSHESTEEDTTTREDMDWINCNSCCRQPGDEKDRTFVLTSCGHIFCDLCLTQIESKDKCGACSSQCQLIQLSSKLQKYKSLEKQHSSATNQIQELEGRYSAATSRIHELEQENQRLRSLVSQDRGGGGVGGGGTLSATQKQQQQHDHQTRNLTPQIPSPKQSPSATRISPGRITLVKSGPGAGQRGSTSAPHGSVLSPLPPYGTTAITPSSSHYPPHGSSAGPPPFHFIPHQPDHHTHPGAGYYRSFSPAQSRNPSPTSSRGSSGPINQQLSLLPPLSHHHPHPHHHPSPVHNNKPTASSSASALYPSSSQQHSASHHYAHPPPHQHHHQQLPPLPRPFASNGTVSPVHTPDAFRKSNTQNHMGYKKFAMSFDT